MAHVRKKWEEIANTVFIVTKLDILGKFEKSNSGASSIIPANAHYLNP